VLALNGKLGFIALFHPLPRGKTILPSRWPNSKAEIENPFVVACTISKTELKANAFFQVYSICIMIHVSLIKIQASEEISQSIIKCL